MNSYPSDSDQPMNEMQRKKRAEMEKIFAKRYALEKPILKEYADLGYPVESVATLMHRKGLSNEILPVLFKYAGKTDNALDTILIHTMCNVKSKQPPEPLLQLFETIRRGLGWYVGSSIADAKLTHKIDDWLEKVLPDEQYGRDREMLCLAAGRHMDKSRAEDLLIRVYDEFPGHVPLGLKLVGGEKSLDFLRSKRGIHGDWKDKETDIAMRRIERRLEREKAKQAQNIAPLHKQRDKRSREV